MAIRLSATVGCLDCIAFRLLQQSQFSLKIASRPKFGTSGGLREYRWFEKLEFHTYTGGYFVRVYFQAVEFAPVVVAVASIQGNILGDVVADTGHHANTGFGFTERFSFVVAGSTPEIVAIRNAVKTQACADIRFNRRI